MLLSLLSKEEKYYFLDLLSKVISIDGPVSDYEKKVIELYKAEMGSDITKYRRSSQQTEQLINYLWINQKQLRT